MHVSTIVFSVIAACVSIGSILIAVGVLKGKIHQHAETSAAHSEHIKKMASKDELAVHSEQVKKMASKDELAAAIKRSDDLYDMMLKRAEEDRQKGQGQYRDFYNLLTVHGERIKGLETWQNSIADSLKELKVDLREGFRKLEEDLKQLGKRV